MRLVRCLSVAQLMVLLLTSCADYEDLRRETTLKARRSGSRAILAGTSYWNGGRGRSQVVIQLDEQKAYFYKGGELAGVSRVSSGREGYRTPAGSYRILDKNPKHRSTLYGKYVDAEGNVLDRDVDVRKDPKPAGAKFVGAPMPYFMRFYGGYGMHAGYLPGYPASHGCIRMPDFMAEQFYANAPVGTPVIVRK
jgi:lipoprotein-anchoring transpeptidase ErfK/SrfK